MGGGGGVAIVGSGSEQLVITAYGFLARLGVTATLGPAASVCLHRYLPQK